MRRKSILLTVALVAVLTAGLLTACGDSDTKTTSTEASTEAPAAEEETTEMEAPAEVEEETEEEASGDDLVEGLSKSEYDGMSAEDLIAKGISDPTNVSADEYAWLISTFAYVDIEDPEDDAHTMRLADSITSEAIYSLSSDATPELSAYLDTVLASPYPQVRGYAMSLTSSIFGTSDSSVNSILNALESEEDNFVLWSATRALSNEMKSDQEVADFIFRMADHEYNKIRLQAALAIGNTWSIGVDGTVDKIISMMEDEDKSVRATAIAYSGKLHDDKVISPIKKILNDADQVDFHDECVQSLVTMWYDYPFHEYTDKKAYQVTMKYLKTTPRDDKIPDWQAVGEFNPKAEDSYKEWKKKAKYFDTDEVYKVMVDIVKDGDASYLARVAAVKEINTHCHDKMKALGKVIKKLDDREADLIQKTYDDELAK